MKRPCFALTLLLAALAGSLLAVGSAKCQTGLEPAPSGAWHAQACPFAPGESSGSLGNCHDEDARWHAQQAEERLDYLRNYDQETLIDEALQGPMPAETTAPAVVDEAPVAVADAPATVEEVPAVVEAAPTCDENLESDYSYRSGYDSGYDRDVYPYDAAAEAPAASGPVAADASAEVDPYWSHASESANQTEELDPYWTTGELPADCADVAKVTEELDPYWTSGELPADVANATIDSAWAKDAIESVEAWIEKLNALTEPRQAELENAPAADSQTETPVQESSESLTQDPVPVEENVATDKAVDNADPTYGAHLWDDCDLGDKRQWSCPLSVPVADNYGEETAAPQIPALDASQRRTLLLIVARSLDKAGAALQAASQNIVRLADDQTAEDTSSAASGTQEYPD